MDAVQLPNMPAQRAQDYKLDGFNPPRYARVIYAREESKADRAVISAQAWEVNAEGALVASEAVNGAASRSPSSGHTIAKTGIGDTHTLKPGFVRVVGDYSNDPETRMPTQQPLPEGTVVADTLPATAEVGALYWVGDKLFRWDNGLLDQIMRGKAEELAGILSNSDEFAELDL